MGVRATLWRIPPSSSSAANSLERFELYYRGIELCNGYHELLDAREYERRFEEANRGRVRDGREPLPVDQLFLEALRSDLPSCSGVALGFDRVVMIACDAKSIDEVLAFPLERPTE